MAFELDDRKRKPDGTPYTDQELLDEQAAEKEAQFQTTKPTAAAGSKTQTLDEFLTKYKDAIDANGKFIPGKANLAFDDMNATDVYNNNIGAQREKVYGGGGEGGDMVERWKPYQNEVNADWIEDPRGKGWLDDHKGVVGGALAIGAAALTGGGSLAALGSGAGSASGLAGTLGMNSGWAATALNTGALTTGMGLARGQNLAEALKGGLTSAALSPVGGWASGAVGGGTLGALAGGAAVGGASAALRGKDLVTGLRDGLVNAGVGQIGKYADGLAGGRAAGEIANVATKTALKGGSIQTALANYGLNKAVDTGWSSAKDFAKSYVSAFNGGLDLNDVNEGSFPEGASLDGGVLGTGDEIAKTQEKDMSDYSSDGDQEFQKFMEDEYYLQKYGQDGGSTEEPNIYQQAATGDQTDNLGGNNETETPGSYSGDFDFSSPSNWLSKIFGSANTFLRDNKELANIFGSGVSAAARAAAEREKAQMLYDQKLDQQKRYSDSVIGMKPTTGIINSNLFDGLKANYGK